MKNGIEKEVEAILSTDVKLIVKKGDESTVESKVTLPQQISAPVKTGQKIGKLELWQEGKLLGVYDLIAKKDVQKRNLFDIFRMLFRLES